MSKLKTRILAAVAAYALAISPASGGRVFRGTPAAEHDDRGELVPYDTELPQGISPQTAVISSANLDGFLRGQYGSGGWRNGLIGGDFGTNLWQRGTTSASITTALLYGPDRWWGLSGASTAFTIIKETSAADVSAGYSASARIQRTAAQTGVLPVCFGQVLTSANSYRFANKTVEFSADLQAGANFSAAGSTVSMTIGYSVSGAADQTAANFSTKSWTGQVNVSQPTIVGTSYARYSVVAAIPATATQLGVSICYTPVGTAGANDWFEVEGAQLDSNPGAIANNGAGLIVPNFASLERRPASVEAQLQYAYFYELKEGSAILPRAMCQNFTTSLVGCYLKWPTQMRAAPVFTGDGSLTNGFSATVSAGSSLVQCTALALSTTPTSNAATSDGALLSCASSAGFGTAGTVSLFYDDNGSGVIAASAEL